MTNEFHHPYIGMTLAMAGGGTMITDQSLSTLGGIIMGIAGVVSIAYAAISKVQDARVKRLTEDQDELKKLIIDKDGLRGDREKFWVDQQNLSNSERDSLVERCGRLEARVARLEGEKSDLFERLESMGRLLAASLERILTMGGKFTGEVPLIPRPSLDSEARLINDGPAPSLSMLLIVEDNDSVRQTLADLFPLYAPNKFRIEQAINIAEGKLKLDAKPDVVLLDLMLPDGDGVEILKAVRERAMPTKVYVMTARHPDTLDYVKQYNPDGLYIKPTPASIVVRAVLEGLKR